MLKLEQGDFYMFDEVLDRLKINESRLKRLVSEGEIRAFRFGDQMGFRKSDVENLELLDSTATVCKDLGITVDELKEMGRKGQLVPDNPQDLPENWLFAHLHVFSVKILRQSGLPSQSVAEPQASGKGKRGGEFFTFDETLNQIKITEGCLKWLVSEGEIRAFREGDAMKFRAVDVNNLDVTCSVGEACDTLGLTLEELKKEVQEGRLLVYHPEDEVDAWRFNVSMIDFVLAERERDVLSEQDFSDSQEREETPAAVHSVNEPLPNRASVLPFVVIGVLILALFVGVATCAKSSTKTTDQPANTK